MQKSFDLKKRISGYISALSVSVLVLVAALAPAKAAAISYVQGTYAMPTNTATLTATYGSAQAAGDMNIIAIGWDSSTITLKSGPVDTKGNVYKLAVTYVDAAGNSQAIYYAPNIAGAAAGANAVTVTLSASSAYPDLKITEYSGVNSLDQTSSQKGDSTAATSGSKTTTQATELLFGALYNWGSVTAVGSGYTQRILDNNGALIEDEVVTTTGSHAATATVSGGSSGEWLMQLATFYESVTTVPAAATGLTATAASSSLVNLSWTASTGATSYEVLRSTSGGAYTQIGSATSTTYADSTVIASTAYSYEVEAVNSVGSSGPSNIAAVTTPASSGTTLYVSTTGNDNNSGSSSAPWATITHAASVAVAGDTIIVEAGTYPKIVTISASGTQSAPIVFQGQPGAIIDGSTLTCCATLSYLGGTVANGQLENTEGLINIGSTTGVVNYVTVEGFIIRNFTTALDTVVPAGIFVATGGTGIVISGNTITGINSTNASNPNSYPVGIFGTSSTALSNLTFSNNIVTNNLSGESETVALNGNVQGFSVFDNQIYGNSNIGLDIEGFYKMGPTGSDQPSNGDVYQNKVYENSAINNPGEGQYDADGIYCDGCKETVIEQNTVYANDYGIEAASELAGGTASNVIIRNNLVYGNNSVGISIGGYAANGVCTSGDCGGGSATNIYVLNNTLYDNQQSTGHSNAGNDGELQTQYRATGIVMENNIIDAPTGWFYNNQTTSNTLTFGSNDYYTTSSSINFSLAGTEEYSTVAKFDTAVKDTTSIPSNPQFDTLPSCTFNYQPVGTTTPPSDGGQCTGTTNFDIPTTSLAFGVGNVNLGTPSGSGWSSYQLSQPFVGTYDFSGTNLRVNGGKINMGAYEQ